MSKVNGTKYVPYKHRPATKRPELSGMMASSLPMAAMFMRSKLLSYASLFLSIQAYLNEPVNAPKTDDEAATAQPPLLRVLFSLIGVATCYMDIIFPSTSTAARIVQKSTEPEVKA